jgi:protein TonB
MGLVAAIHVAVLFAIARSLGIGTVPIENTTEGTFIDEPRPPEDPPRMPDPVIVPPDGGIVIPREIPPLAFEQEDVIEDPPRIIGPAQPPRAGSAEVQPQIVGVRQDPRHPLTKPQYSARIIREGGQGTIELEVYVQPNGRVADARVVKSTGFDELDLAAIAEAKRNWRLVPATRDGVPIAQWYKLRVTFKLDER